MHELLMDARVRSTPPSGHAVTPAPSAHHGTVADAPEATPWTDENRRGLAFAAAGAWTDAADAFSNAADALSRIEARDPAVHEAQALVLANLAQASFRAGRPDDAIRHAQRACALRVALCGEDAVAVARSRSDLAVILAACGRLDEAPALLARAIAAVEGSVGDEDLRLAVLLENAGRVALAAGQPATAEPFLLRLHGLLGAHDLSTDRADTLLAYVFEARVDADVRSQIESAAATPAEPDVVQSAAAPHPDSEWEDQPLRDAVVLTDALLRTTPTGSPVVRPEHATHDPWSATPMEAGESAERAPVEEGASSVDDDIFGAHALELTDAPAHAAEAIAASEVAAPETHAEPAAPAGGLGFEVQYGVPLESGSHAALSTSSLPPASHPVPERAADDASDTGALNLGSELELVPEAPQRVEEPVVPPVARAAAPPSTEVVTPAPPAPRQAPRPPRIATAAKQSRAGLIGGSIAALVAAAAAGWYYLNGGF
jgi:tetratricopeptide (TPR) repeat protein